jgi:hypothetical protein
MKSNTIPSFSKGDLVKPRGPGVNAWRRLTHEERNAWYAEFYRLCREGKEVPFDSGGESRLAPNDTYIRLSTDTVLTVVRARVSAPEGYGSRKGCCQVFDPTSGQTLYVYRGSLTTTW